MFWPTLGVSVPEPVLAVCARVLHPDFWKAAAIVAAFCMAACSGAPRARASGGEPCSARFTLASAKAAANSTEADTGGAGSGPVDTAAKDVGMTGADALSMLQPLHPPLLSPLLLLLLVDAAAALMRCVNVDEDVPIVVQMNTQLTGYMKCVEKVAWEFSI